MARILKSNPHAYNAGEDAGQFVTDAEVEATNPLSNINERMGIALTNLIDICAKQSCIIKTLEYQLTGNRPPEAKSVAGENSTRPNKNLALAVDHLELITGELSIYSEAIRKLIGE